MRSIEWIWFRLGFPGDSSISQRCFVLSVLLLFVTVPLFVEDLFPFSRFPMFSDAPQSIVRTSAYDREGRAVALSELGLFPAYMANRTPQLNIKLQRPIDAAYRFWTLEEFAPLVQERLRLTGLEGPVVIRQELYGPVEHGTRRTVGLIATREWEVDAETASLRK